MKREHNEDAIFFSDEGGLYLVADGMGGHSYGEVASALAIQTISDICLNRNRGNHSFSLKGAIQEANQRIHLLAKEEIEKEGNTIRAGMGTTIAALYYDSGRLTIAHVGDSRVYRLRDSRLELLTQDHSLATMALVTAGDKGVEKPFPANRFKNVITRAVGLDQKVEVEVKEEKVKEGDLYLLCSDGLTNMVPGTLIQEFLVSESSISSACKALIDTANRNGGKDNISALLVQF